METFKEAEDRADTKAYLDRLDNKSVREAVEIEQDELLLTEIAKFLYGSFNTTSKGGWEELPEFNEVRQWWLMKAKEILAKAKQHYKQKRLGKPELRNFLSAVAKGVAEKSITIDDAVDRVLALIPDTEDKKSIERIAEELGINFYDLHPYIIMREEEAKKQERLRIFTEGEQFFHPDPPYSDIQGFLKWWQALNEEK